MRHLLPAFALLCAPQIAAAQAIGGRVVTPDSAGIAGAIVTLLDGTGVALARALSDEHGRFNFRMTEGGRFTLQVMRLAHETTLDGPFAVPAGRVIDRNVVVTGRPVTIAEAEAASPPGCLGAPGSGTGELLWGEVRKALLATQLTRLTRAYTMDVELYVHRRSPDRTRAPTTDGSVRTGTGLQALSTIPPERLATDGWVTRAPSGDRYHAPDDHVLLSESFAGTHCLRLVPYERLATSVRLAFSPLPGREQPEIRGEIHLDRASLALRRVSFTYINLQQVQQIDDATGEIGFRRLPEGSWIIDSWSLALPFVEQYVRQEAVPASVNRAGVRTPGRPALVLTGTGWRTTGGAVTRIRFGEEIVWSSDEEPGPPARRRPPPS